MAPDGRHALTVYTICPDTLNDGTWDERREELADKLLAYTERYIPGLRESTLTRVIITPADFRALTRAEHHAFGGLAPVMERPNIGHQTPIENLWFIGQQSESGGGIFNVLPSAYRVARRLVEGQR
jgi:phytoene dehydrogenase-like protein